MKLFNCVFRVLFQRSDTGMDYHTKVFDVCAEVMKLVQVRDTVFG